MRACAIGLTVFSSFFCRLYALKSQDRKHCVAFLHSSRDHFTLVTLLVLILHVQESGQRAAPGRPLSFPILDHFFSAVLAPLLPSGFFFFFFFFLSFFLSIFF